MMPLTKKSKNSVKEVSAYVHKKARRKNIPTAELAVESIYGRIREILETAKSSAYHAVNFAMVQAYRHIGKVIVEDELKGRKKADYGEYLLKGLAQRLTKEFGKGFTETNLRYMRLFYLSFEMMNAKKKSRFLLEKIHHAVRDESQMQQKDHALRDELPVVRLELSWTHYRLLLKVERPDIRKFYLDECLYKTDDIQLKKHDDGINNRIFLFACQIW